ncbi:MAG: FxsA family protein [Polyangiaceae bacterium]|nr:FxsA family protein [Polyangiaceae bacterium]
MRRVVASLFALFALEVLVLAGVAPRVGWLPTLGWMLGTALAGAALARSQGLGVLDRWIARMAEREQPEEGLVDGLLVLTGGALLVLPGLVGDAVGALLLVPPLRRVVAERVRRRAQGWVPEGGVEILTWSTRAPPDDDHGDDAPREIIDVEGVAVDDDRPLLPPARGARPPE